MSFSICTVISKKNPDGLLTIASFLPLFSQLTSHFLLLFAPVSWCLGLDPLWGFLGSSFPPAAVGNILLQELLRDGCSHCMLRSLCLWGRRRWRCCNHPCPKTGVSLGSLSLPTRGSWCQGPGVGPLIVLVALRPWPLEECAHALSSRADLTWVYSGFSL